MMMIFESRAAIGHREDAGDGRVRRVIALRILLDGETSGLSYGAAATRGEAGNIKESVCDTPSGKRVEIANDGRASLVRASIARRVVIAPPPHLPKREKAFFFSSRGSLRRPGRFAPKRVGFFAGAAAAFALPPKPKPFFAGGASASFFFPKPKSAAEPPFFEAAFALVR